MVLVSQLAWLLTPPEQGMPAVSLFLFLLVFLPRQTAARSVHES
jgi:hypothetical protein